MHENRIVPLHLTQMGFLGRGCGVDSGSMTLLSAKLCPRFNGEVVYPGLAACPVFRLRKCNLVQAGQMIPSYSFSRTSSSSSDQCWTFIDVVGQVKRNGAICQNTTALWRPAMM